MDARFGKGLFFLCVVVSLSVNLASAEVTRLFDMGTPDSPVKEGYQQVLATDLYIPGKGYGWESKAQEGFDVVRPPENPTWHNPGGQVIPNDLIMYKEHNDLTRDGVMSKDDLIFRADVPNGIYRVAVTIGDLESPLCSMQLYINDELAVKDLDAKHFIRRAMANQQYGFPKKVRRTVLVKDGIIRIRLHGDDSGFKQRFADEVKKPVPFNYLLNRPGDPADYNKEQRIDINNWDGGQVWVFQDIGSPFTKNAVNAVEVYPWTEQPLVWKDGKLVATAGDANLAKAVELFNAARFAESEKAFDAVSDKYSRALGYLWLAGRPQYEEEFRLLPKALDILNALAPSKKGDMMFAEITEGAKRMDKALYRFVRRADEQRTYNELLMISGEVDSMQPDDPLYYKGKLYAARGFYMIHPSRGLFAEGAGRQILQELERAGFADNRYVRWYLYNEWSEHPPDWVYLDYSALKQGAPQWAAECYEAFNREVDLSEWWIKNRQAPDGSMGGGWGDDVESLRSFSVFGGICPDATSITIGGIRKIADGAWNSGGVDTEAGYFERVGDTEHTGEWTGDTLVAMIRTDYGNPTYLERAMKTGKLMRDLWMDYNAKGQFLMRSNFLGATGVGPEGTLNDSRINFRPASPAWAVLWYNNSPTLRKLFIQWIDSWLTASMSTEKGKPRGIVPQEIGFAEGEIGDTNAPTWYTADHTANTVNYDWSADYHEYIAEGLIYAYKVTGDKKYLEPLELEAAFVTEHLPKGLTDKPLWKNLPEGSNEWVAAKMAGWPKAWESRQRLLFPERFTEQADSVTLTEVASDCAEENHWSKERWPHVTAECIATDRIYWPGMGNAWALMTASRGGNAAVTYRGLGREFAAAVLRSNASSLKIVLFNMSQDSKKASIQPWLLDVGATYRLTAGPDADGDAKMDKALEDRTVDLQNRGQEIGFTLPGRSQYVLEVAKVSEGGKVSLSADLALSEQDIKFVPSLQRVDVTVHNVGSAAVRGVLVALYNGDEEIGHQRIPGIEAPLDLDPKYVRVSFGFTPTAASHAFTATVETEGKVNEITMVNNKATALCATPSAATAQSQAVGAPPAVEAGLP